jgi:MFS family permease
VSDPAQSTASNPGESLRTGVFPRFMLAEFISMVGSWMQTQAQQLTVEQHANTSFEQALVSFVTLLIIPLLGPWGGTAADRFDRRRILIVVIAFQAALAVLVGGLVHAQVLVLWHLVAVGLLLGITHAFEGPAYSALLPELVPREKIARAIALDRSVFHAARIIGPAIAGLTVAALGIASAFYANALSFIFPLAILYVMKPRPRGTDSEEKRRRTGFIEGWRHVRSDAPTFRVILITAANTLFCSPFVVIMLTWYGKRTLHLSASEVGWLMSLSGIGALSASFALLFIPARRRIHFMRLGSTLSVLAMLLLAAAHGFAAAGCGFAMLTLGLNFLFGIGNQLVQERTPDEIRGRVSAVASLSFLAVLPFSGLAVSGMERLAGMRTSLVLFAIGYAVAAGFLLSRRWPREFHEPSRLVPSGE